jgi:hypothetical protein
MCAKLNSSVAIHRLAADLRLRTSENPVRAVLAYCHRRITKFLKEYGTCSTLDELLALLANKLGTRIIEINNDQELRELQSQFVNRGELIFATLDRELAGLQNYGITLKLQNPEPWEQPYVSIIDCRDRKRQRRYHTKWHELGHLLILTDQTRLAFRRSHDSTQLKSAEESLVDSIAGEISFYPDLVAAHLGGEISFERIEQIRQALCPEASMYSAVLNVSKLWPTPCIWVEAQVAAKKSEENALQESFAFRKPPQKSLRAVHTSANEAARECGFGIIPRFRVPRNSVITQVFEQGLSFSEAFEDLDWWESSDGARLGPCRVHVMAKRIGGNIHALLVPLEEERCDGHLNYRQEKRPF